MIINKEGEYELALLPTGDIARHEWIEMVNRKNELLGQAQDSRNQRQMVMAETRKQANEELVQAMRLANSSQQEARRGVAQSNVMRLTSPVDGVVQQLRFTTLGAAVPPAEPIMLIVPSSDKVEIEAMIENKDIGYVKVGTKAAVKIQTYEYTRYGTISGVVTFIGQDAIADDDGVLTFPARISLDQNYLLNK